MEFNVDDGVRLVRSLTDKVMSVMSRIIVPSDTDHSTQAVTGENNGRQIEYSESTDNQICNFQRRRTYKRPDFKQNCNEITDSVLDLVEHKSALSAVHMLPVNGLDSLVNHPESNDMAFIKPSKEFEDPQNQTEHKTGSNTTLKHVAKFKTFAELILKDKRKDIQPAGEHSVQSDAVSDTTLQDCDRHQAKKSNHLPYNDGVTTYDTFTEFENDMAYLKGCNNKTSTPTKDDSTVTLSEHTIPHRSLSSHTVPRVTRTHYSPTHMRKTANSPRKTSYSPYRKHLHTSSPLVRLARTVLNRAPALNPPVNDDLQLLNTDVDVPKPRVTNPSSNTSRPSGSPSVPPMSARVKPDVRRSLFSESASWSRFLPLATLQSGKPLGYDAYQQFINVTKTDVLPKYFFENEDEEAVYYLKVKYLDDNDTK